MALMVTGNLLGAGILALPITLGPAGLLPAVCGIVVVWWLMLQTSYILADQPDLVQGETGGLPTFFGAKMGPAAKWLAVAADLIILYGVLTAYLSGTTSILVNLFDIPLSPKVICLIYFMLVAGISSFGPAILRRCNTGILALMALTFLILIVMTVNYVEPSRAIPMQWTYLPAALPVVLTAFLFHNLIPTVYRELSGNKKEMRRAMLIGSSIGLVMNLAWTVVVFCALPMTGTDQVSILGAFAHNQPATIPLSRVINSEFFTNVGLVFAVLSMTAAFMANGIALRSFLLDLTDSILGLRNQVLIWVLAFIPPFLVSVIYPDIFLKAMNLVGGFGICVLFGILPSLLLLRLKGRKRAQALGWVLLVFFCAITLFEVAQELGLTHIHPDKEYWLHQ